MEMSNPLLVVIDPGHGGDDIGAQWDGRLEKDDNLRLGIAVRDALLRQGMEPLMTRDTDLSIPLQERVKIANRNDADLFVSLHRNFDAGSHSAGAGVENRIYLTAQEETAGRAARLVMDEVVKAGVQTDRGVNRGNHYVLRRTRMPSMMLELGAINNQEDNRLFDENLLNYADAVAKGVAEYFELKYQPPVSEAAPAADRLLPQPRLPVAEPVSSAGAQPARTSMAEPVLPAGIQPPRTSAGKWDPPVPKPKPSSKGSESRPDLITGAQRALNRIFGADLQPDGGYDAPAKRAAVRAMQQLINESRNLNLPEDGVFGAKTRTHLPTLRPGEQGNTVFLLQILLALNGYDPGSIDGAFGSRTRTACTLFQRDNFLVPDGIAGPRTFLYLFR